MAYSNLLAKVEEAAKATVEALALSGVSVFTGGNDETLTLPSVVCVADNTGKEVPLRTGNFVVTLRVDVQSQADDSTLVAHNERVATVFDAFADDGIPSTLSGHVDDFTVMDVHEIRHGREKFAQGEDAGAVMSEWIALDLLCCASDIS